jgi:hypothetical protein
VQFGPVYYWCSIDWVFECQAIKLMNEIHQTARIFVHRKLIETDFIGAKLGRSRMKSELDWTPVLRRLMFR